MYLNLVIDLKNEIRIESDKKCTLQRLYLQISNIEGNRRPFWLVGKCHNVETVDRESFSNKIFWFFPNNECYPDIALSVEDLKESFRILDDNGRALKRGILFTTWKLNT